MITWLPGVEHRPSPNYSERGTYDTAGLIMHFTAAGPAEGSVSWMCNAASKVSAHFDVARNGSVIQLVGLDKAAWHAGAASMLYKGRVSQSVNRFTIGIEVSNWGLLRKTAKGLMGVAGRNQETGEEILVQYEGPPAVHAAIVFPDGPRVEGMWEPFSAVQIEALVWLVNELQTIGYAIDPSCIRGHDEVALPKGRKIDPGPLFPWERFGRQSSLEAILL